jgi:hypothetical protein
MLKDDYENAYTTRSNPQEVHLVHEWPTKRSEDLCLLRPLLTLSLPNGENARDGKLITSKGDQVEVSGLCRRAKVCEGV